MNWQAFAAISTAVYAIIVLISVIILARQLVELRRATWANSFLGCVSRLQAERLRKAREKTFELGETKRFEQWTDEEKKIVDMVCHNYDIVGMIAAWGMLPKEIIVDSWCDSIRRLWAICEPRVEEQRKRRKALELWDDFQWLAKEAEKFDLSRARLRKRH